MCGPYRLFPALAWRRVVRRSLHLRVFLSYRRDDTAAYAGRLRDTLVDHFGEPAVFQDVSTIGPGQDFTEAIDHALDESDAVLVLIGRNWLGATDSAGGTRLHDPDDYVRIEVGRALARDLTVIPILVGGAALPPVGDLPEDMAALAHRQAVELHDATWHQDVDGLIGSLRGPPRLDARRRRWLTAGAGALGLIGVAIVAVLVLANGDDNGTAEPAVCDEPVGEEWVSFFGPNASASGTIVAGDGTLEFVVSEGHYRKRDETTWEVLLATEMKNLSEEQQTHGYWLYDRLLVGGFPFEDKTCFFVTESQINIEFNEGSLALVGFKTEEEPNGSVKLVVEGTGESQDTIVLTEGG